MFLTVAELRRAIADLPGEARVYHVNIETGLNFAAFEVQVQGTENDQRFVIIR